MKQKVEVEHKLVAIEKKGYNKGDIVLCIEDGINSKKGTLAIATHDRDLPVHKWLPQQLLIQIDGKDVAAYPSKEGLLPIHPDFIQKYVKANGKVDVWCEMGRYDFVTHEEVMPKCTVGGFICLSLEGGANNLMANHRKFERLVSPIHSMAQELYKETPDEYKRYMEMPSINMNKPTQQQISKKTAIEKIVQDDIDDVRQELQSKEGPVFLESLLMYGFTGWFDTTVQDLQTELDNRFDGMYVINNEL